MIRHLVFLNYADSVTQSEKDALMADLEGLKTEVDGIAHFGARRNVSPETDLHHGLTEMFWFDFRDEAARDAYLANETHKAIGARLVNSLHEGTQGIYVCDVEI